MILGSEQERPNVGSGVSQLRNSASAVATGAMDSQPRLRSASLSSRVVHGFLSNKPSLIALIFLVVIFAVAIAAPLVSPADPLDQNLPDRLSAPMTSDGGTLHILGTDQLGRDILSRIIHAARFALPLVLGAAIIACVVGTIAGLYAGYREGIIGRLLLGIADMQIAFPYLVVAIAILGVMGTSTLTLFVALSIFGWAGYTRVASACVLGLKQREFILAARTLGASNVRILLHHLLPNMMAPLIVLLTFNISTLIIVESALSFIGLGIQPPTPSWGNMLNDSQTYLGVAWWPATFPGLAIMLTVLAINIVGDRLRDVMDPSLRVD